MISALVKKLLRDIVRMRGQFVTIALVVACGVAAYVSTVGTFRAIDGAKDGFYERHRFADVWAPLERAPRSLRGRIERIPGVHTVETRIVTQASLPMPTMPEPASAVVVSLPPSGEPALSTLYVREGRLPDPSRPREVVVSEPFAKAHGLRAGQSKISAVIEGEMLQLDVVGLALSPEHVFTLSAAIMMPDDRRYGVLWMSEPALAAACRMEGAFDEIALRLQPGASPQAVIHELDRLLVPYGGRGAYARKDQMSHRAVTSELGQLQGFAVAIPIIFLGVAAFLLNVVLSRIVELQRPAIAVLRALGYRGWEVGLHYLELVAIVVLAGAILGVPLGSWVGHQWTRLYQPYFRFPVLDFELDARTVGTAVLASLASSVVGALRAVRAVSRLAPAEAMSPPAPPVFGSSLAEQTGVLRLLSTSARMVARETLRRPARLVLSALGIALAMSIVVVGSFQFDAVGGLMDLQFGFMMREDLSVTLRRPVPRRELEAMRRLPGVRRVEGARAVAVRFRAGHHQRSGSLTGEAADADLRRVVEWPGRFVPLDRSGIAVSRKLAEILEVKVGDTIDVEALEGAHPRKPLRVVRLVDDLGGLGAYAPLETVAEFMGETPVVSSVTMSIDPREELALDAKLRGMRDVAGVGKRADVIAAFRKQMADSMYLFTGIITVFAAVIAVGIVYNNARVALSTRAHELASLRVLGFTRGEVSGILLGELALQVALAIPMGLPLGWFFATAMMSTVDPEQYRFPLVISARTYVFSIVVVLVAAVASALVVRRRVDRLDLIGVLKTRE